MVRSVLEEHVVVACYVEHLGMRVVDFPVVVPGTQGLSNGARRIIFEDSLLHLSGGIYYADVLALDDLVADAPRDDAWMVAVAQHHSTDVLTETGVDDGRIVIRILLCTPAIESLVDDQHAQRVAGVEEGTCGGIMTGADEVEARLLHLTHLADFRIVEGHRTQHTVVMMYAGTVDEHLLTVEHEAPFSIERERADAEFSRKLRV